MLTKKGSTLDKKKKNQPLIIWDPFDTRVINALIKKEVNFPRVDMNNDNIFKG